MSEDEPRLIEGGLAVDDRGAVGFVNELDLGPVRRFYTVSNHEPGYVRAWHAHRKEEKYAVVLRGAAKLAAVEVDDWDEPSRDAEVGTWVLSGQRPSALYIPAGYANGSMTLTEETLIVYFSTATLAESRGDDIRYPARHWDPWQVEER